MKVRVRNSSGDLIQDGAQLEVTQEIQDFIDMIWANISPTYIENLDVEIIA